MLGILLKELDILEVNVFGGKILLQSMFDGLPPKDCEHHVALSAYWSVLSRSNHVSTFDLT